MFRNLLQYCLSQLTAGLPPLPVKKPTVTPVRLFKAPATSMLPQKTVLPAQPAVRMVPQALPPVSAFPQVPTPPAVLSLPPEPAAPTLLPGELPTPGTLYFRSLAVAGGFCGMSYGVFRTNCKV